MERLFDKTACAWNQKGLYFTPGAPGYVTPSTLSIGLGDVGAGVTGTLEFTGKADTSVYTMSAEVDVVVTDGVHEPFDWLWIQHDVDLAAPEDVEIAEPLTYISPYTNTVRGTVHNPSGVPIITLEAQTVPAGTLSTVTCIDATPDDGQWSCAWNVGDVGNGARFRLRALATDTFDNGPTAGSWVTLTIDTHPPTVTLDAPSETALLGAILGPDEQILLTGIVGDDQQASSAEICFEQMDGQTCDKADVKPGTAVTGTWQYVLKAVGELDQEEQIIFLYGVDGAGNRSIEPLSRTYQVDTVPPVVTVTTWMRVVPVVTSTVVLRGTVSDGSDSSDIYILRELAGTIPTSTIATRDGSNWSYILDFDTEGEHRLHIEARDAQGNASGYGPYTVSIGGEQIYLPLVLRSH